MFPELELREGWVTVICLLLMVLCVAWSIQAADWADGLSILQGTALLGGVLGIVLAKSRVPNRLAHLLSLLAGWTWSLYLTSQVLARAIDVPGPMAVVELEERFYDLFLIPFHEGMAADNHVFILLLGFLLWLVGYFCAWAVFRWQRVWWSVIVCGVATLLNMNYAAENLTVYLILFLLFALLLVVRASLASYEQEWRAAHIGYSPELISLFLRAGLIFSMVVILLAWAAPAALASRPLQPFWDKIGEPWREFQERASRIFRDLNYQNEPPLVSLGDRRMWFGGPVNLTDTPIADVDASTGRYWRVVVFHEYLSDGWLSNDPDIILIGANEQDLAFPEFELRSEITQTVTLLRDWQITDSLIAAGQPLRAGLPLRAAVTFITHEEDLVHAPDVSFPAVPGDPSALYARRLLQVGESYEVLSSLTEADEESLRHAGIGYPDWVTPRYLQLPESLPERVRLLAAAITEGLETPYDRAKAIEAYLRSIPYDEEIEGPGLGQDGVDYFLFDAKAGYCEYYASAMVIMLRSVGIPARYVRGYSQGETEDGLFRLRESDGHAWPEVFFPGYGWIEFEPTGGEPPLLRPESQESEDTAAARPDSAAMRRDMMPLPDDAPEPDILGLDEEQAPAPWWRVVGPLGWSAVAIGGLGLAGGVLLTIRRRRDIEGLTVAERVYEDLVSWARHLLRIEPLAHQTPHEYANIVAQQVPRGREAVEQIAGLYVEERFGAKEVPGAHA
jgi:transglutaminase-like putative cysteine protease